MTFTHLHTHSTYSDGLAHPFDLVQYARALGFSSLALTDHNTLDGHGAFLAASLQYGIRPILGVELRVHLDTLSGHMVVLTRSRDEHTRLYHLVHRKRKISLGDLKGCGVVTSGCLGGIAAGLLRKGDYWSARDVLLRCQESLGADFYIEVQPTFGTVLPWLLSLSRDLGIRTVATNDVHYLKPEDSVRHQNAGLYLATDTQMRASCPFIDYEDGIKNAEDIAHSCLWN